MGAWGTGYFENDATLDALPYILKSSQPFNLAIPPILQDSFKSTYLEIDESGTIIIIAIILIAFNSKEWIIDNEGIREMYKKEILLFVVDRESEWRDEWNDMKIEGDGRGMVEMACDCLDVVLNEKKSESSELWKESLEELFEEWKKTIVDLKQELEKYR